MKYCSDCGDKLSLQEVAGDQHLRFVCQNCGKTHYDSPKVLVAAYVCVGDRMLWIRRGTPPAVGKWALPGGFMEKNETPEIAASRELQEETGVVVSADDMTLVSVSSILHMAQTHLVFRCHLRSEPRTVATPEATEFGWFDENDLPWAEAAFTSIEPQIRQMYRWLRQGNYGIRVGFVDEKGSHYKNYPLATKN